MVIRFRLDQLRNDSKLFARLLNRGVDDMSDVQFLRNLPDTLARFGVLQYGSPGNDLQVGNPGKLRQQVVVQTFRKNSGGIVSANRTDR